MPLREAKGGRRMRKFIFGTILLAGLVVLPVLSSAQVSIQINVPPPPPIPFAGPPGVVILPGTGVYVVPDVPEDIFFRSGWWWRHHGGHWYRSRYYDRGWVYYRGYPAWHKKLPPDWRYRYSNRVWGGRPWNPNHIHYGKKGYPPGWGQPPGRPPGYQGGRPPGGHPPGWGPGGRPGGGPPPGGKPRGGPPHGGPPPGGGHPPGT